MPADPFSSGFLAPHEGRLVTTSEAGTLLGVDEATLWRLLDEGGVRVHALHEDGEQLVGISVGDLLYLRAQYVPPASASHDQRALELERLRRDLEEERGQRLQNEILKSHLAGVGERLETTGERLTDLEGELTAAIEDRDRQLTELNSARDVERAALCADRARLAEDLERATRELESLRQAVLVGRTERQGLRRDLEQARDLERATQRYCDKLEARRGEIRGED